MIRFCFIQYNDLCITICRPILRWIKFVQIGGLNSREVRTIIIPMGIIGVAEKRDRTER